MNGSQKSSGGGFVVALVSGGLIHGCHSDIVEQYIRSIYLILSYLIEIEITVS